MLFKNLMLKSLIFSLINENLFKLIKKQKNFII